MKKTIHINWVALILVVALFLSGCHSQQPSKQNKIDKKPVKIEKTAIPYSNFRKVSGWLSNDEVLIHSGSEEGDRLSSFNVLTGKTKDLFSTDAYILTTAVSQKEQEIVFQEVADTSSKMVLIDTEGNKLQELPIKANGYVSLNWNKDDTSQLFIAYYHTAEELTLLNWDTKENKAEELSASSLYPSWYSENLYLYVDNKDDFLLESGQLYMGDVRSNDVMLINSEVSDFFLHEDTFITYTPSDFNEKELLLTYQYPFMVDKGFMTIPKVTMNERINFPYLTQAGRDTPVYGIIAKESAELEKESGEFVFGYLDFDQQKVIPVTDVPENAPIQISENGKYCLYGWRFEYLIDNQTGKIHDLIEIPEDLQA
ncbi:hypothetical protein [Pisciglobus halotolerans]|uniref:YqgU-like 6-bladed beta-propeller domain-containing protein n=1 Tax=Pisciglobus halotolerans TaxID=745365 RepID=A0A1I3CEW7_9LACT|nr:hypothetical protein [Pisciglobus halotolerans]SFH73084.1 hypothetical protein SAMN04489868_11733 [Pisciglobus halotolerans]